jgi:hypothetical protein
MARRNFDMLRACFYLLALLLGAEMITTVGVIAGCAWAVLVQQSAPMGACQQAGEQVKSIWSEALAAILALLLAARGARPPDQPPPGSEPEE